MAGHDRLTPEGKKFYAEIEKLKELQVRVGFKAGDGAADDGTDMCDIAMWNELGTYNMPSRPFMKQSVDGHVPEINAFCKAAVRKLVNGGTAEEVLSAVGQKHVTLMQKEIRGGGFTPNAQITITGGWMRNQKSGKLFHVEGKKSEQPLINTGQMRQAVHYFIKEKE